MTNGIKCPVMRWGSGVDQAALIGCHTRLDRWFTIKNIAVDKQLSKTWTLSDDEKKDPKNVCDKFKQSVGLADNFRVHRQT